MPAAPSLHGDIRISDILYFRGIVQCEMSDRDASVCRSFTARNDCSIVLY